MTLKPAVTGAVIAAIVAVNLTLFSRAQQFVLLSLMLAFISAIYVGFAISDGRILNVFAEVVAAGGFLGIAVLGLSSSMVLALGYFGHGLWDILHHPRAVKTSVKKWYPPACLAFDWLLGLFILVWLRK
jgi:hypothetical protein